MTQTIIITGASQGMGAETARILAKTGANIMLMARSKENLDALAQDVKQAGGEPLIFCGDVADRQACFSAVSETLKRFGRLDALVNNAGMIAPITFLRETSPEAWQRNIKVNLFGPFHMIQAAIPELAKTKGRVVNVSSGAAVRPIEGWGAYCVSKAALTHLTRVLAAEESDITAISLRPGVVDTPMQAVIRQEGPKNMPPEKAAYFQKLKDKKQLEPPKIPARAIAWLALYAPLEMSGEFVEYTDLRIKTDMFV